MPLNGSAMEAEESSSSSSSQSIDPGSYAEHIVPSGGRLFSCNNSSEQQIRVHAHEDRSDNVPKVLTDDVHREGHFSEIPSSSTEGKISSVHGGTFCLKGKTSSSTEDAGHGGAYSLQDKAYSTVEHAVHGGAICLKEKACPSTGHNIHAGESSLTKHISTQDAINRGPCSLAEYAINGEACRLHEKIDSSTEHVTLIEQAVHVGVSSLADRLSDKDQFRSHGDDEANIEKGLKPGPDDNWDKLVELELGQASGAHDFYKGFDDEEEEGHCRVCHLVFDVELGTTETIRLGCLCKEDLAIAHRNCAEAWFKIKGNRVCEICGATAQNIVGNEETNFLEQWNDAEVSNTSDSQARCWQSLSLCNFFLACMVVTFILLWLFRVTIN